MARERDDEVASLCERVSRLEYLVDLALAALAPLRGPAVSPCPPDCTCPTSDSGERKCAIRRQEAQRRRPWALKGDPPLPHDEQGPWTEKQLLQMDERFKRAMLKSRR
jgi:hypothetical protein